MPNTTWNKSAATNAIASALTALAFAAPEPVAGFLLPVGLFALSGALTNWLAIHMLFEKVPGLYGSGVVPEHFEDFKRGIHALIMHQFFTRKHVERFFESNGPNGSHDGLNLDPVINDLDLDPAFDMLVETVKESKFGGMLGFLGGESALETMRTPFTVRMKQAFRTISRSTQFQKSLHAQLAEGRISQEIIHKIDGIVSQRLNEMTPAMVKEIVQKMIRDHLGWLVVWGGVFGGFIGLLAALLGLN